MRFLPGEKLLVATGNKGKLVEISALLSPFGVSVTSLAEFGLAEPEETERKVQKGATLAGRWRRLGGCWRGLGQKRLGLRYFVVRWRWFGPAVRNVCLRGAWQGRLSGPGAGPSGMGMIRSLCRMATTRPSAKWTKRSRTGSAIALMLLAS